MAAESSALVIAKRLLDHAKAQGFTFHRVAEGPDGALVGSRETGDWTDTVYLAGFSRDCAAIRERTTSLIILARLKQLGELRSQGVLSEAEFEQQKSHILGS